jgi:5-methylcytosine-specific restriction endonuclease McrA
VAIDYRGFALPKPASRYESKKDRKLAEEANRRKVYAAVDKRDGRACRLCGRKTNPEATGLLDRGHRHHLTYRSKGGQDSTDNLLTLCASCHHGVHSGRIRITGDADAERGCFVEVATDAGWKPERWI